MKSTATFKPAKAIKWMTSKPTLLAGSNRALFI
jgi:hypothetical protein